MKKTILILLSIMCAIALADCSDNSPSKSLPPDPPASSTAPSPAPLESETPEEILQQPDTPAPSSEPPSAPVESNGSEERPQQTTPIPAPTPAPSPAPTESKPPEQPKEDVAIPTVNIQVGSKSFTATMYDNESAWAIVREMPFTLEMDDFVSQEKVTALTFDLPAARPETPGTINAGDIYLWSSNNLVLFYTTFSNSYSYVPIGTITDVAGLTDALGSGSVKITFSIK